MNVRTFEVRNPSSPSTTTQSAPADQANQAAQIRHLHRERDFGVGYGNSSGYASNRRYTTEWAQPLFRCA
jgi:hypothetical protein